MCVCISGGGRGYKQIQHIHPGMGKRKRRITAVRYLCHTYNIPINFPKHNYYIYLCN